LDEALDGEGMGARGSANAVEVAAADCESVAVLRTVTKTVAGEVEVMVANTVTGGRGVSVAVTTMTVVAAALLMRDTSSAKEASGNLSLMMGEFLGVSEMSRARMSIALILELGEQTHSASPAVGEDSTQIGVLSHLRECWI
jgi:hypothetical protein